MTNQKSSSTNNVADYAKPARFYAKSQILIECTLGNITKIVFDCNNSSYATVLKNSIGASATVSSDKVTVELNGTSTVYNIPSLTAQVRMDALTVTYEVSGGVQPPVTPTLTAGGKFVGSIEVEILCATEGATIYYTTDESEPTEESDKYSAPFEIADTTTVKAIAVNEAGKSNVATATYTRVAKSPEISFDGEATFEESIEVTIEPAEGTTAYYTLLDDKTPTNKSTEYKEPFTIKADATLQVIAYDEDGYASPVVKQAFKKAASGEAGGTATLVEDANDLNVGDKVVIVAKDTSAALSTEQKSNNRGQVGISKNDDKSEITLNDDVQVLTLEAGTKSGTFAFNTGSGYLYAASSTSNYLKTQEDNNDNGSWTISIADSVATVIAQGSNTRNCMQYNKTSKLFACYGSASQQAISLYKVNLATVEDYVLNVSEAGWATLYLGYNVTIPEDVTCYVISEVTAESAKLEEVTGVLPANTGAIIEATKGEYTFEVAETAEDVESILTGTTKNEYVKAAGYVLGIVDGNVGLYMAEMNGGVFLNNANKAYLPASEVPTAQGAKALKFRFDDQTTGINGVATGKKPEVIFDLYGRKVNNATAPGLYIINGKKVMVK